MASAYLLALSFRYLWTLWTLQSVEWTYAGYLLVALPGLVLALAAHLIRVETGSLRRTPREQYFEGARPLYGLLVAFPVFGAVNAIYHAVYFEARLGTTAGPVLLVYSGMLVVCLWLAFSRRPRDHWIGLAVLWAGNLLASVRVLTTLAP